MDKKWLCNLRRMLKFVFNASIMCVIIVTDGSVEMQCRHVAPA